MDYQGNPKILSSFEKVSNRKRHKKVAASFPSEALKYAHKQTQTVQ